MLTICFNSLLYEWLAVDYRLRKSRQRDMVSIYSHTGIQPIEISCVERLSYGVLHELVLQESARYIIICLCLTLYYRVHLWACGYDELDHCS